MRSGQLSRPISSRAVASSLALASRSASTSGWTGFALDFGVGFAFAGEAVGVLLHDAQRASAVAGSERKHKHKGSRAVGVPGGWLWALAHALRSARGALGRTSGALGRTSGALGRTSGALAARRHPCKHRRVRSRRHRARRWPAWPRVPCPGRQACIVCTDTERLHDDGHGWSHLSAAHITFGVGAYRCPLSVGNHQHFNTRCTNEVYRPFLSGLLCRQLSPPVPSASNPPLLLDRSKNDDHVHFRFDGYEGTVSTHH